VIFFSVIGLVWIADMRRRDASIWFMIAAAVFAALALLALLLVYGPS
jgi:hypothetical protein